MSLAAVSLKASPAACGEQTRSLGSGSSDGEAHDSDGDREVANMSDVSSGNDEDHPQEECFSQ